MTDTTGLEAQLTLLQQELSKVTAERDGLRAAFERLGMAVEALRLGEESGRDVWTNRALDLLGAVLGDVVQAQGGELDLERYLDRQTVPGGPEKVHEHLAYLSPLVAQIFPPLHQLKDRDTPWSRQ